VEFALVTAHEHPERLALSASETAQEFLVRTRAQGIGDFHRASVFSTPCVRGGFYRNRKSELWIQISAETRSRALPGNAQPGRLCRHESASVGMFIAAKPLARCIPRRSLGTRLFRAYFFFVFFLPSFFLAFGCSSLVSSFFLLPKMAS